MILKFLFLAALLASTGFAKELHSRQQQILSAAEKAQVQVHLDQPYAGNENPKQAVDLYLPKTRKSEAPLPVIALIHGGAWINGDRSGYGSTALRIVQRGEFAVVCVGYRLTGEVGWPAQIHDCKAAIRWIRGRAKDFNLDPDKIAVWGSSAGGHLSALLGTSGEVKSLEGELGAHLDQSSRVQAVVNFCGPTDFLKVLMFDKNNEPIWKDSAVLGLFGGTAQDQPELAKAASPVTYATQDDPPFITFHGTQDRRVHFDHASYLDAALKAQKVTSFVVPITDGGHGSVGAPEVSIRAYAFLNDILRGVAHEVDTTPIPAPPERK